MHILNSVFRSSLPLLSTPIRITTRTNLYMSTASIPSVIPASLALEWMSYNKNLKFVDASWHMDKTRNALDEFSRKRIQGAVFLDIDKVADVTSSLPHMLPSPEVFAESVSSLGIQSSDHVCVYATKNCFSAPRVWWMFRVFGHKKVSVIDGGLEAWNSVGGPVEEGPPVIALPRGDFTANLNTNMVVGWEEVLNVVNLGSAQILDARSKARFLAQAPEPRPGLPGGHIPGSLSLPFTSLVSEGDVTKFRSKEEIRDAFVESGIIFGSRTILSCGSGVSAAVLCLGLDLIGKDIETLAPIYDGSWTEWAGKDDLPRIA